MTSAIATKGLGKTFGKGAGSFVALENITISIAAGEAVAIVGKSGSGKSTLMHVLALMDTPSTGSLYVAGQAADKLSKRDLNKLRNHTFGFVFQQFFLNGNATVLENTLLPLKIAGINKRERTRRGLEALKAVDLSEKAFSKANDLSGGQKQRAVIARALINEPQIIFADEPTGNLDTATGAMIEDLLFELNKKNGITLVIVTHDPDLAKRCDRQIYVKDGRVAGDSA